MSSRRTRGGDLKDSKEEEGEEAVAIAETEASSDSDMVMMVGHEVTTDMTLNAGSSRESKKRRVPTKEASNEFLDPAKSYPEVSREVETTCPTDDAVCKAGGGPMQCGAAAGQASMSESTAHSEPSTDTDRASVDGVGVLDSGESLGDAAVAMVAVASYKSVISSMARANDSNVITAENYYILHWLCRIRDVSCLRGLRISFLQPDFLWTIYRPMMRSKKLWRTDEDIGVAVDLWCSMRDLCCTNRAAAEERYGHISDWVVSSVTDMGGLFEDKDKITGWDDEHRGKELFNDDISRWDVSNVTNMSAMFHYSESFNQPVGDWDVSKVISMRFMFSRANAFNQPVGDWDVSNVTDMVYMFFEAYSFNQPVGDWDVSEVTDMYKTFYEARTFNQSVGDWDVSKVANMNQMFCGAQSFNQPVGNWDVSKVTDMNGMFYGAQSFNQDLSRWDMQSVRNAQNMFDRADAMQRDNKPAAVRDDVYVDFNIVDAGDLEVEEEEEEEEA